MVSEVRNIEKMKANYLKSIEYAHLYFNAKYLVIYPNGEMYVDRIGSVLKNTGIIGEKGLECAMWIDDMKKEGVNVKLILVHPNEMTTVQKSEYDKRCIKRWYGNYHVKFDTPVSIKYLLDECIDTFDLIENDVAITESQLSKLRYKTIDYYDEKQSEIVHEPETTIIIERKPPEIEPIGIVSLDEEYEKASKAERENIPDAEGLNMLSAKDFKEII